MSDTAADRYCPYCRAQLTKPNDCDACGKEFLRSEALTELQAQNWTGREVDTRVAFTGIGIVGAVVVVAVCLGMMAVQLELLGEVGIFAIIGAVAISLLVGAVASHAARSKMARKYGRIASAPLESLSDVLFDGGVVILGPSAVFALLLCC